MKSEESSQAAELNAYHRDINPRRGTGCRFTHQPTMLHEPGKRALHHPAPRQHDKSSRVIAALDHFHLQLGPVLPCRLRELAAGETTVHPELAQPGEHRQ